MKPLPAFSLGSIRFLELQAGVTSMHTVLSATNNLLKIVLTSHADCEEWTTCLDSIAQNSSSTLQFATLKTYDILDFQSCLSPLLSVRGLRALHIENFSRSSLAVFDSDIAAIVNSWPSLQEFVLPTYQFNTGNLTDKSLKLLARLPKLRVLRVVINDEIVVLPQDLRFLTNPPAEYLDTLTSFASAAAYLQT
ncbi:hypothetical protein NLJ89_g10924 [Agrocybe chaxingu]|uniref:Uncharacterized protein n=1 Tax=Agrocybe chaxingu TaxID=84603 RepID=A0A9W8JTC7_9AGAR|nr:hypothetical protein NLJ89_g10924 [Agrocybe chaxingu]